MAYWAYSAATDPAVASSAVAAARLAVESAARAASEAAAVAAAATAAHDEGRRYCPAPWQAGTLALSVRILILMAAIVVRCSCSTLPIGVLGGHLRGRLAARVGAPLAAVAIQDKQAEWRPPDEHGGPVDTDYTLLLADCGARVPTGRDGGGRHRV